MLITQYKAFSKKKGEIIEEMHTRSTIITNELHYIGEVVKSTKYVHKILSILPKSWESRVNTISRVRDLKTLTIDELIGN